MTHLQTLKKDCVIRKLNVIDTQVVLADPKASDMTSIFSFGEQTAKINHYMIKRSGDKGSSCLRPRDARILHKGSHLSVLRSLLWRYTPIHVLHFNPKPLAEKIHSRNAQSTLSKALQVSSLMITPFHFFLCHLSMRSLSIIDASRICLISIKVVR